MQRAKIINSDGLSGSSGFRGVIPFRQPFAFLLSPLQASPVSSAILRDPLPRQPLSSAGHQVFLDDVVLPPLPWGAVSSGQSLPLGICFGVVHSADGASPPCIFSCSDFCAPTPELPNVTASAAQPACGPRGAYASSASCGANMRRASPTPLRSTSRGSVRILYRRVKCGDCMAPERWPTFLGPVGIEPVCMRLCGR